MSDIHLDPRYGAGRSLCTVGSTNPLSSIVQVRRPTARARSAAVGTSTNIQLQGKIDILIRPCSPNTDLPSGQISLASPLYGSWACDSPYDLVLASMQSIGPLTGTSAEKPFGFAVYTGDLVC